MQLYYIKIKDLDIPIKLNSNKNYIHFKIGFNIQKGYMNISKPSFMSNAKVIEYINKNEDLIYNEYLKVLEQRKSLENLNDCRKWITGEKLLYKGQELNVIVNEVAENIIDVKIQEDCGKIVINIFKNLSSEDRRYNIINAIKKILKNNTEILVYDRLKVLTKKTGISYNCFKVKYVKTRWGSCVKSTRSLNFSSRLVMFPVEVVDSVIVHELCHIIEANHGKNFWKLVYKFMPEYDKYNDWIKKNKEKLDIE